MKQLQKFGKPFERATNWRINLLEDRLIRRKMKYEIFIYPPGTWFALSNDTNVKVLYPHCAK